MRDNYYIYILTNTHRNVLYTGVTNNLPRRMHAHKNHLSKGFTQKYNVTDLVYYESFNNIIDAIEREKQIKGWNRQKKNALIAAVNPELKDLSDLFYSGDAGFF